MTNWKEIKVENDNDNLWDREDPIEGRFVKVEDNIGPNDSKMYTLKTDDGDVKLWGSTVLDNKLMGVPQGTLVRIIYKGKAKGKKGNSYHDFSVYFDEDDIPVIEEKSGYEKAKEVRDAIKGEPDPEMPPDFLGTLGYTLGMNKQVDPKVSKYFSDLVKKRTDNNYGFNNPEVVKRAIEKRKENREAKRNASKSS